MTALDDDPGGPLLVTPAGTTVVWTDAILASADRLGALQVALHLDLRRVNAADHLGGVSMHSVIPPLEQARALCADAADKMRLVAEQYSSAEQLNEDLQRQLAAMMATALGEVLPLFAALVILNPLPLGVLAVGGWLALPDDGEGRLATLRDWMLAHPQLVTSPEFVRFVSLLATSIDDGARGATGVPFWLSPLFSSDDNGVASGALTVATLGGVFGMFHESDVVVERVRLETPASAPTGARDLLDRVPEVNQVRIETYEAPGMPTRYAVYIGPTETFSPFATTEPWDMTSNVYGVAGLSPGSLRAVEDAMVDAGIRSGDEVQVVGFSQGGLIATMVAASPDWNVVGAATYGAPAGNISLPDGVAGIAVRNTDDFIPALAGPQLDHHLVQIEREAFAGDTAPPTGIAAPAHQRFSYEATADAIDEAQSQAIRSQLSELERFGDGYVENGGSITVSTYHAVRVN
ncbi:MAG: hypothetical protein ABIR17_07915 [Pseudolysinimonas sp.]|uniref:hypothetical protein n=1 Tax=Pseudolysinimonas sp. TaxID=2680009 RepID=UPI003265DCD5